MGKEIDSLEITDGLERIVTLIKAHEREDAKFGIGDCSSFLLDAKDTARAWIKKLQGKQNKKVDNMKTYAISLQNTKHNAVVVVVVHNATSVDNAQEKLEKAGWLDSYAILDTIEVVSVIP